MEICSRTDSRRMQVIFIFYVILFTLEYFVFCFHVFSETRMQDCAGAVVNAVVFERFRTMIPECKPFAYGNFSDFARNIFTDNATEC